MIQNHLPQLSLLYRMGEQSKGTVEAQILSSCAEMHIFDMVQKIGFQMKNQEISEDYGLSQLLLAYSLDMSSIQIAQHVVTQTIEDESASSAVKDAFFRWIRNIYFLGQAVVPILFKQYWKYMDLIAFFEDNKNNYYIWKKNQSYQTCKTVCNHRT